MDGDEVNYIICHYNYPTDLKYVEIHLRKTFLWRKEPFLFLLLRSLITKISLKKVAKINNFCKIPIIKGAVNHITIRYTLEFQIVLKVGP